MRAEKDGPSAGEAEEAEGKREIILACHFGFPNVKWHETFR